MKAKIIIISVTLFYLISYCVLLRFSNFFEVLKLRAMFNIILGSYVMAIFMFTYLRTLKDYGYRQLLFICYSLVGITFSSIALSNLKVIRSANDTLSLFLLCSLLFITFILIRAKKLKLFDD